MKNKLFTKDYTLMITATVLGAAGGIAGNFALSYFVFEETGSTLLTALLRAIQTAPAVFVPLIASPVLDSLPRKPFLICGDIIDGTLYMILGLWLLKNEFSYGMYIVFSLLLTALNTFDGMAFNAIFPSVIPKGCEEKGFTVSSMVYPVLQVVMSPLAALMMEKLGVGKILIGQSVLSFLAAFTESFVNAPETHVKEIREKFSLRKWWKDITDAVKYVKADEGLSSILIYSNYMNSISFDNIIMAFFTTTPGFSLTMYSFFTAAEFIGRSIGGVFCYRGSVKRKKRYKFIIFVYHFYELMNMILLFLPYPLMMINRACCGFLGMNSGNIRYAAVQAYIPDDYRARINALGDIMWCALYGTMSVVLGALGEVMDYRYIPLIVCSTVILLSCFTVIKKKDAVSRIICFDYTTQNQENEN